MVGRLLNGGWTKITDKLLNGGWLNLLTNY